MINACDAGREGELIFTHVYETSGIDKPVERLWISSMTKQAIREGFENPSTSSSSRLSQAARSRSEADWLVGMNATRAATIRGEPGRGVVSLGRVQTPTLAMIVKEREIQAFVPEPYWLVHATFEPRRYEGLWFEDDETRLKDGKADEIVERVKGKTGRSSRSSARAVRARAAPLRPDLAPAGRQPPLRLLGAPDAQRCPVTVRGPEGDYVPPDELPLLSGDSSRAEADRVDAPTDPGIRRRRPLCPRPRQASTGRVVNDAKVDDHHAIIPTDIDHQLETFSPDERRIFDLIARRSSPSSIHPPATHARRW